MLKYSFPLPQNVCVQYTGVVSLLKAVLRLSTVTTRQDTLVADLTALG